MQSSSYLSNPHLLFSSCISSGLCSAPRLAFRSCTSFLATLLNLIFNPGGCPPFIIRVGRTTPGIRLTEVIYHHGEWAGGSHYAYDILRRQDEWVRFDDIDIDYLANERQVLCEKDDRHAYILFYVRIPVKNLFL